MNTSLPVSPYSALNKSYGTDLAANSKSLGTSYATKALGGDPELAAWYEDATAYYNSVMSGETPMPDQASWDEFLSELQWAQSQLSADSSSWGDPYVDPSMDPNTDYDPYSGEVETGTEGNHSLSGPEVELSADGSDPGPYDVFLSSTQDAESGVVTPGTFTLDVPPPCTVTSEFSTDNRYSPPETVIKFTVTNPSVHNDDGTPATSIIYAHDYEGYSYVVNSALSPDGSFNLTDSTGLVTTGAYVDPSTIEAEANAAPMANVEPEEMTAEDGTAYNLFAGTSDSVLEFNEEGMDDGISTVNDVMGNSSITVKETDTVVVESNDWSTDYDGMNLDHSYVMKVTHADGTVDTFLLHNEYQCNINVTPEHITFKNKDNDGVDKDGNAVDDYTGSPTVNPDNDNQIMFGEGLTLFADHFTINASESVKESDATEAADEAADPMNNVSYPSVISDLADEMGLSSEELIEKLSKSKDDGGYGLKLKDEDDDGKISKDEVKDALEKANFPPTVPDSRFIEFLSKYDTHLKNLLEATNTDDVSAYMVAMQQVTAHTVDLLKEAYPDSNIEATHSDPKWWWECNDITFDGQDMEAFKGGENDETDETVAAQEDIMENGIVDEDGDHVENTGGQSLDDFDSDDVDYYNQAVFDLSDSDRNTVNPDPFSTDDY